VFQVEVSAEFLRTLDAALAHPDAPNRNAFLRTDWQPIQRRFRESWATLLYGRNPYRRTLVAAYPDPKYPRFYYSVQGWLRPDGIVVLESISIDWDWYQA
jgi:hypothetical protein